MTVKVDLSGFDDAEKRFRLLAVFLQKAVSAAFTGMIASMTGGGGGSTYEGDTFNINVSGAADAQTTARAVAAEIMKMQKNARQRS